MSYKVMKALTMNVDREPVDTIMRASKKILQRRGVVERTIPIMTVGGGSPRRDHE
jgi:hypothetical protein